MRLAVAIAGAAVLTGCGQSGPDFTEQANAPAALLIDEFAAVASLSSPLSEAGLGGSRVRLERRGSDQLLFTIPSSENKEGSTFLLQFVPGDKPLHSSVTVTINVPPIPMGLGKVLSEAKVERNFREQARRLIEAAGNRESTNGAGHEIATMFDALTVATNPSLRRKLASAEQQFDLGDEGTGDEERAPGEPSDEELNRSLMDQTESRREDGDLGSDPQGTEPQGREPEGTDPNPS